MFGGLSADKYDRQYSDKALIGRLWDYFRPRKRAVITLVFLIFAFSITGALIPVILAAGVGVLESDGAGPTLILVLIALLISVVLDYVIFWVRRQLTGRVVAGVVSDLREDAFKAAIHRDLAFYDENKTGKVVSRITSDTQELSQVIVFTIDITSQVFEFLILFLLLLTREWRLTLLMLGMMPLVFGLSFLFRRYARIATRQGSRAMAAVNDNIQESVTGITVAKNFRQEALIYGEFTEVNNQSYRINLRRGVGAIKIAATGGVTDARAIGEAGRPQMTEEEMTAICDEAHNAGILVAAHAQSKAGITAALRAGWTPSSTARA